MSNLNKLRKADLIAMIQELRAEIKALRNDSVVVDTYIAELRAEIEDLRAEPQPQPQPEPQPQPAPRRAPRDLSGLKAAAMHYKAPSKFDEHGNIVVFVNGAWRLA